MSRKDPLWTIFAIVCVGVISPAAMSAEVIVAAQRYISKYAVMSPSGAGFSYVDCGGDLTRAGSTRYFVNVVSGTTQLPPAYFGGSTAYNTEIAAWDMTCREVMVLTAQGNIFFRDAPRWSPDGSMIAANAMEFDLSSGTRVWQGIVILDVGYSGGRPVSATNLVRAIPTGGSRNFDWSPDSRRIVYVEAGINGADLFSYALDGQAVANITNTANVAEDQPAYSSTERIAYTRQLPMRGSYRFDIFTIPAGGGLELQVTTKSTTGAFVNMTPCYSPDGLQIAFSSGLAQGDRALYRIRSDGTGKAMKIVGAKGEDWRLCHWRP